MGIAIESRISQRPQIKDSIRRAEYYNMTLTFDRLYADSKEGKTFTNLVPIISSRENIMLAYRNIKRNKGIHTPGVDGRNIFDIENMTEEQFVERVRRKLSWYQPKPVKRVEIPKPNGKTRPLGIPCIMDRIVQQCILQVMMPICEAKFHKSSNGFRPNRSTETAIAQCYRLIQKEHFYHVVDIDIKGFFDNIDHSKLKKQIWAMGIQDKKLISIISAMLKAPIVMPDGSKTFPDKGTPQGGIISPLLANIVLNELDHWIAQQWKDKQIHEPIPQKVMKNGAIHPANRYYRLRKTKLKEIASVRYADDFKIFCKTHDEAVRIYHATRQWLKERLKLETSDEKSKVVNLKRQYSEFLGFKIKVRRKGENYVVISHMSDKAFEAEKKILLKTLDVLAHPTGEKHGIELVYLWNARVLGTQNYYRFATMVAEDFNKLGWAVTQHIRSSKLRNEVTKNGIIRSNFAKERYEGYRSMRFLYDTPMYPIQSVTHKNPMEVRNGVCNYTPEGRAIIHKSLKVDLSIVRQLMNTVDGNNSIEFIDNRISKYCAQYGRCAITGEELSADEIHCHHKKPKWAGGTDAYNNLIIIHKDMHKLIHATDADLIKDIIEKWALSESELNKVNELRMKSGNKPIQEKLTKQSKN